MGKDNNLRGRSLSSDAGSQQISRIYPVNKDGLSGFYAANKSLYCTFFPSHPGQTITVTESKYHQYGGKDGDDTPEFVAGFGYSAAVELKDRCFEDRWSDAIEGNKTLSIERASPDDFPDDLSWWLLSTCGDFEVYSSSMDNSAAETLLDITNTACQETTQQSVIDCMGDNAAINIIASSANNIMPNPWVTGLCLLVTLKAMFRFNQYDETSLATHTP